MFRILPDPSVALEEYLAGGLDFIEVLPPEELEIFASKNPMN